MDCNTSLKGNSFALYILLLFRFNKTCICKNA